MNISEKKLERCIKPLPFFDKGSEGLAKKIFTIETHKFFKKMLLEYKHLNNEIKLNDRVYILVGLFSEGLSAVIQDVETKRYFESSINLVQESLELFYKSYTNSTLLKFHNIELSKKNSKKVKDDEDELVEKENSSNVDDYVKPISYDED